MSLVVAGLLWAAVAADEYVGASMPQYGVVGGGAADYVLPGGGGGGGGGDDYRGNEPAAPAALDYKFHEDTQGNIETPTNDIETEIWKKPSRKQRDGPRRQRNEVGPEVEPMAESISKLKSSRRSGRQRARAAEEHEPERRPRRGRRRGVDGDVSPPLIDYEEKPSYRENSKIMEDDIVPFTKRETTERIIRRKPRDRYVRPLKSDEMDFEEELETDKKLKDALTMEYPDAGRREWSSAGNREQFRATRPRGGGGEVGGLDLVPLPPEHDEEPAPEMKRARVPAGTRRLSNPDVNLVVADDDDDINERLRGDLPASPQPKERPTRPRSRNYDYGDNYYDMKRVLNMKNKLPSLLRRPTTRARGPYASPPPVRTAAPPWLEEPPPARTTAGAGGGSGGASELFELLYPGRRAGAPAPPPAAAPALGLPPPPPPPPPPPAPPATPEPPSSSTTLAPTSATSAAEGRSPELSLLERSRLSILKKAQKKEGLGGREASKKPPVLLQVTSKVPTVVMVEPPTSPDPWLRARAVSAHAPHQLEKVKRLMRRKLIANARSIQDLTENWDDLVCDYIDTALLEETSPAPRAPALSPATAALLVILSLLNLLL